MRFDPLPQAPTDAARDKILDLLAARRPGSTICPSEAARALMAGRDCPDADSGWRAAMPLVHAATDRLHEERKIRLSWQGQVLAARSGPYRIGRAD